MSRIIQLASFVLLLPSSATIAAAGPVEAARGVVGRLLPEHADQFLLEQIPSQGDRDVFEIESVDGRVVVVLFYGDKRHYGIVVETSLDGRTWKIAGDLRENKEPSTQAEMTCRFEPRPVRFIRVRVPHNSANTGRHLVEVMAFEK